MERTQSLPAMPAWLLPTQATTAAGAAALASSWLLGQALLAAVGPTAAASLAPFATSALASWGWASGSAGITAGFGAQHMLLGLQQVASAALLAPPQMQNYTTVSLIAAWSMDPAGLAAAAFKRSTPMAVQRRLLAAATDVAPVSNTTSGLAAAAGQAAPSSAGSGFSSWTSLTVSLQRWQDQLSEPCMTQSLILPLRASYEWTIYSK